MSILDDNDNGIENTLIDPFNMTVSNEAYPFPVEQFIPPEPTNPPGEVETSVVPTLTEDAVERFHRELKHNLAEVETADDITDTPQEPAEAPSPEGDMRVSLELEEEVGEQSTQEVEDVATLTSLVEVRDRLNELGGISQSDVYQIESLVPGLITSRLSMNRFSRLPTPMGLDVSLETIGSKIVETVKNIILEMIERLKRIFKWVTKKAEDKVTNTTGVDAKEEWQEVMKLAARVDSLKGVNAFKAKFGDTEAGRKSGSTQQFIRLHAMSLFNKRVANFNVGFLLIQRGSMIQSVRNVEKSLRDVNALTTKAVTSLKSGGGVEAPTASDLNLMYVDHTQYREHISKLKTKLAEPATPSVKLFENAVEVYDGVEAREALLKYGENINTLSNELKRLQNSNLASDADVLNSVKNINLLIQATTNLLNEMSTYALTYGTYYSNCVKTCKDCKQILRTIGALSAVV